MFNYSTSAAGLLALIYLTSTVIDADGPTTLRRRSAVASKSSKGSKNSKDGSMRMLLDSFDHAHKLEDGDLYATEFDEYNNAEPKKRFLSKSVKTAKDGSMRTMLDAFGASKLDAAELESAEFGERSDTKSVFAKSVKAATVYHTDVSMIDPPKLLMSMPTMFDTKAKKQQESRALYSWSRETTDVQTECEEVVAGHPEVCVLVCTEVTSIMNGEKLVDEYSRLSQHKCDSEDDDDGWQSGGSGLGSGTGSGHSKSTKSKSGGSGSDLGSGLSSKSSKSNLSGSGLGSGSASASKSSKSTIGGSGSGSGSKGSKKIRWLGLGRYCW